MDEKEKLKEELMDEPDESEDIDEETVEKDEKKNSKKLERQISITTGSHQVQIISEDPEEHIDYLLDRALLAVDICRKEEKIHDSNDYC